MTDQPLDRRQFLKVVGAGIGGFILSACRVPISPAPTAAVPETGGTPAGKPGSIVGDVLEYELSGDWPGRFGLVRFRLHEGFVNGDKAYFIRTDGSDGAFASDNGLVWVPLLATAGKVPDAASSLYLFEGGAPAQLPVLSSAPPQENYSPLFQVHRVKAAGQTLFDSEAAVLSAASAGEVSVEDTQVFVNYPVVKWPGGELSVDAEKREYLGGGQLLEPVDTAGMTATFKLHECFPGSRYIVTDTSAAPMAPMMAVSAASPTQALIGPGGGGTARIWVFANGIEGSGVMGFQPAIFDSVAGDPKWSPFWNHFTLRWRDEATPRVLKSVEDVQAAMAAGEVEEFNGTPDTHPDGFVVNCPVPVLAENTFTG